MSNPIKARRSLLFTPANRPERIAKALLSGTDIVCVDLEDAVAAEQKAGARRDAFTFLHATDGPERVVRINHPDTDAGQEDIDALKQSSPTHGIILVAKVDKADTLPAVAARLSQAGLHLPLAAMIETIGGVENVFNIVGAMPQLAFAMFGGADLAAELGTRIAPEPLAYGRSRLVYACRHANIDVLDMPCLRFRDAEAVQCEADHARLLGFTGKAAIHPDNLGAIHSAFTPTAEEIEEARRVLAIYHNSTTGVGSFNGTLVEKPVARTMELVLARARAAGLIQ